MAGAELIDDEEGLPLRLVLLRLFLLCLFFACAKSSESDESG
jgi:hypothetical protein